MPVLVCPWVFCMKVQSNCTLHSHSLWIQLLACFAYGNEALISQNHRISCYPNLLQLALFGDMRPVIQFCWLFIKQSSRYSLQAVWFQTGMSGHRQRYIQAPYRWGFSEPLKMQLHYFHVYHPESCWLISVSKIACVQVVAKCVSFKLDNFLREYSVVIWLMTTFMVLLSISIRQG